MLSRLAAGVAVLLTLCALPLLAQSASNDTLSALLTEVRLLRRALERSAAAPQIQLLGTRLAVQNERVQSASRDHEAARDALQKVAEEIGEMTTRLQSITEEIDRGTNQLNQRQYQDLQSTLKMQLATLGTREGQLRARESELAAAVASEQNEWLLLNRRLDEFEKTLAR